MKSAFFRPQTADHGTTLKGYGTTPVGCRGGSRYVEGCPGFSYLQIKKLLVLLVSWLLGFKISFMFLCFQKRFVTWHQVSISCFLMDIDLISKILKILLDGPSGFFGAHLFQTCHILGIPTCWASGRCFPDGGRQSTKKHTTWTKDIIFLRRFQRNWILFGVYGWIKIIDICWNYW